MANIVNCENRPFSYRDFMLFEVEGKEYRMTHGTYRNKISRLKKAGKVELSYNAGMAFYTLKGKKFGKPMTPNHTGVCNSNNDSFSRIIYNLPTDRATLHNIRLKFQVQDIWSRLSSCYPELPVRAASKDICIPAWNIGDLLVRTIIHKSDTVSVTVACSLAPVAVNINGLIDLSNALTRVEERINVMLRYTGFCSSDSFLSNNNGSKNSNATQHPKIPDHRYWVVTMWHFGADSLVEYTGEKFAVTWEIGQNALVRAYTKVMKDKKTRIRLERQEYPNRTFPEIMEEKLNSTGTV